MLAFELSDDNWESKIFETDTLPVKRYRAVVYRDNKTGVYNLTSGYRRDPRLAKTKKDSLGKSSVAPRRSEFLVPEYYGSLIQALPRLTKEIVAELFPELQGENTDPNEERRNHSFSGVYGGGANRRDERPYMHDMVMPNEMDRTDIDWLYGYDTTDNPDSFDSSRVVTWNAPLDNKNFLRFREAFRRVGAGPDDWLYVDMIFQDPEEDYTDELKVRDMSFPAVLYPNLAQFIAMHDDVDMPEACARASGVLARVGVEGIRYPTSMDAEAYDRNPADVDGWGRDWRYVALSGEWSPHADLNEERRDHIHVWSGARQAYDRVDLRFIGTGTGGNNEGRGAYSSGVRGVAQDKYARGALASLTYTADNIPVVYDGKSMTLKEAYGLARETAYRNDEIDEGWMIREINYQAGQLSSDNAIVGGLVDYNELREWMLEEFENESEPLTYEEILADFSKLKALPIERRMGYDYGGGFDTRRYEGKDDKIIRSEMRDFYVDKDRFGFVHYRDVEEANRLYEEILAKMPKDSRKGNTRQKKLELLDKVLPELPEARPAVMEQTWFTNRPEGDVSHLLNWFEAVTPEQLGWIVEGARKAGFSEKEIAFLQRERIDDDDVLIEDGNRMPSGREMYMRLEVISVFRTKKKNAAYLRMQELLRRNPFEERPTEEETKGETFDAVTTEDLRRAHRDVMGDAGKFASEFLVSADIDGMMYPVDYRHGNRDGRVSGWNYVAFSDEHLRVDHVYEYNPETDDFELKWHEGGGSGPRFTETPLGQELVARAFDAIMGSRVDLLLRPSRFYGNPYETRERNPRNALVTEHLHRDVDVSEPKGFATEVSAEISRFGTREGDPTLRDIRARCGSKARFYEVLGAVYETAEAVRSGLAEVVTGRERAMMSNAGFQAADFIKHNATARATAAGRKLYLMGREFAWKLYQEDIASAWAEVERQRRGRGDCGMIGGKCEGKGPSRHGERRWPKARRMR